ncbi:hypothetical protein QA601_03585 [Chitinispirillales bacterium ANBcel5]|uniref:hypothetical protein n=1 Tax=Cellulosispirillum alkaliphilum TaxID=3039283 RepID=UPI002A58FDBA|nr:hypothetical protein [Chitinispirillales bacterium ANBcel5]
MESTQTVARGGHLGHFIKQSLYVTGNYKEGKDMRTPFECEVNYFPFSHLNQIYAGFDKLEKAGIVKLSVKSVSGKQTVPLLKVVVNNKYNVMYDTLDGLNWIEGSVEDNLNYFKNNITADFYFKRSFNQQLIDYAPENCSVFPLGFNYFMKADGKFSGNLQQKIKDQLRNNFLISKYFNKNFCSGDFECYPIPSRKSKILFMARLWNPDEVSLDHLKDEREQINKNRIENIRACRKEFGDSFIGGLRHDEFSIRHAKDLLLPFSLTRKERFLKTIKECNICIATTGLHNSIGWKFGEYVAASRAIVSEPLKCQIPGDFSEGENYLEFKNNSELINNIRVLQKDKEKLFAMMNSNFRYYNHYLQPDIMILNTLLKVYQNE